MVRCDSQNLLRFLYSYIAFDSFICMSNCRPQVQEPIYWQVEQLPNQLWDWYGKLWLGLIALPRPSSWISGAYF